jgi:hypothetical protein
VWSSGSEWEWEVGVGVKIGKIIGKSKNAGFFSFLDIGKKKILFSNKMRTLQHSAYLIAGHSH